MGASGFVGVLTQLWCARVPAVIVLLGCITLALHGTRHPCTTVQSRVGVGVALLASCRAAPYSTLARHGSALGVTVRPWWPDITPLYSVAVVINATGTATWHIRRPQGTRGPRMMERDQSTVNTTGICVGPRGLDGGSSYLFT